MIVPASVTQVYLQVTQRAQPIFASFDAMIVPASVTQVYLPVTQRAQPIFASFDAKIVTFYFFCALLCMCCLFFAYIRKVEIYAINIKPYNYLENGRKVCNWN